MAALFIGGIRDGDWFDVPDDRMQWVVRERSKLLAVNFDPSAAMEPTYHQQMVYQRLHFRGDRETYSIFVAPGMNADKALLRLLEGYKADGEGKS